MKEDSIMSFQKLGLSEGFSTYYKEKGLKVPTEVQQKVIPQILERKSVLVLAQTGTGKTLSYALPLVQMLKELEERSGGPITTGGTPRVLVIVPTKELASQIYDVFKEISHHQKFRVRMIAGGQSSERMRSVARQSFEVLIATPNRVVSALKRKEISLSQVRATVFDEADQIFDLGFKKDLTEILDMIDFSMSSVQFLTATLPADVELFLDEKFVSKKLTKIFFQTQHRVQTNLETFNIFVNPEEKLKMLGMFLDKTAEGRGIVFANQKNQVIDIVKFLKEKMPKLRFVEIHGDLSATQRAKNLKDYREGKMQVLISSDITARGIDIVDLAWVFNFGMPKTAIYYLHRCGRTARGGRRGRIYNLVTPRDGKFITAINEAIRSQSTLQLDLIAKDPSELKRKKKVKNSGKPGSTGTKPKLKKKITKRDHLPNKNKKR
jgi:superfamily II DNA/RNA helicase